MKSLPKSQPQPRTVTCATCRHFVRDTQGISRNNTTGQYFMGTCNLGLTPHSPIKQFADHPHICPHHQPN